MKLFCVYLYRFFVDNSKISQPYVQSHIKLNCRNEPYCITVKLYGDIGTELESLSQGESAKIWVSARGGARNSPLRRLKSPTGGLNRKGQSHAPSYCPYLKVENVKLFLARIIATTVGFVQEWFPSGLSLIIYNYLSWLNNKYS